MDAQRRLQLARGGFPGIVQRAVVDHCHQHLTAEGGQKLHLIPAPSQHGIGAGRRQQAWHQRIDGLAGGWKLLDALQGGAAGLLPGREHRIADGIVLVPDAELGAHPVVPGCRGKDFDGRDVQPGKERLERFVLGVELAVVVSGPGGLGGHCGALMGGWGLGGCQGRGLGWSLGGGLGGRAGVGHGGRVPRGQGAGHGDVRQETVRVGREEQPGGFSARRCCQSRPCRAQRRRSRPPPGSWPAPRAR